MLTRPSAHNKNFPYHVRTTQIGIMEAMTTNTHLGPNTLDHFVNGGSYGVSAPATGKYTVHNKLICFIGLTLTLLKANILIEIFLIVYQPCHDGLVVKALD